MAQTMFQYENIVKCNSKYFNILCINTICTFHKLIIMINFQYTQTACTGINCLDQAGCICVSTATGTHSIYREHKFLWQKRHSHLLAVQFCNYAVCVTQRSGCRVLCVWKASHSYMDIILVTLAVDVSLVINKSVYPICN
jgi:hypothetical protein